MSILVKDWRESWQWLSMWLRGAALALASHMAYAPDAALQIWAVLPADMRGSIPIEWVKWSTVALIALSMLASLYKQPRINLFKRKEADNVPTD